MAISTRVNRMGHSPVSAVEFGKDASRRARGSVSSASFFGIIKKAPDLSNGGPHLPHTEDGLRRFEPPISFQPARRLRWVAQWMVV